MTHPNPVRRAEALRDAAVDALQDRPDPDAPRIPVAYVTALLWYNAAEVVIRLLLLRSPYSTDAAFPFFREHEAWLEYALRTYPEHFAPRGVSRTPEATGPSSSPEKGTP